MTPTLSSLTELPLPIAAPARLFAATGLFIAGSLHVAWAAGSSFPSHDRRSLARAVAGQDVMPSRGACALLGAGLLGTGIVVAGAGNEHPTARLVRLSTGAALLGRGLLGGLVATKVLRMDPPQEPFRTFDAKYYNPLCLALGAAAVASARAR